MQVRCAFVAYRDYDDTPNVEVLDFTSDFHQFSKFVRSVVATGGGDECEDVFSGLQSLANLSWRGPTESSKVRGK